MRRWLAGRWLVLVAVALCSLTGPAVVADAGASTSQGDGDPTNEVPLDILSVTPYVPATGSFEIRFAPTSQVPPDVSMELRIHRRLSGSALRDEVARVAEGDGAGSVLEGPVVVPGPLLGNPAAGWVVTLQVTNSSADAGDRIVVPDDGIHPVSIDLVDSSGTTLWERTVFMVRPPEEAPLDRNGAPARSLVTLALGLDGPPTLAPDGTATIDEATLGALDDVAGLLEAVPEAPLSLAISPNLLTGADRSDTVTGTSLAAALQRPGLAARSLRRSDVPLDVGGLIRSNGLDVLQDELTIGAQVTESETLRPPIDHTWILDDTLTDESLPAVSALGTRRVVVPADRLQLPDDVDATTARSRTLQLGVGAPATSSEPVGAQATPLTVIADDPILGLLSLEEGADPGVVANRVTAELSAEWFTAVADGPDAFPGPQSVLFVPPQLDPAVLLALVPAVTGAGPLRADPTGEPPPAGAIDGGFPVATLTPRASSDQAAAISEFRTSRTRIVGVRSVVGPVEPRVRTWDLVNTQTMSTAVDVPGRAAAHATIDASSRALLDLIEAPPERKVVLTSRDASIPLRFRNGLEYPVEVGLRVRSSRLELPDGERQVVRLLPGDNVVDLRVTVRAPGESVVRVDVTSPDDAVGIDSVRVPVQASTISGVGAALSVASLVVLAWWWLVTVRRRNREQSRRAGHHPSGPDEAPPPAPVGDGSVADGG